MKTEHVPLKVQGRDLIAEIAFLPEGAMVAIKSICEAIGISSNMQREKLKSDPRFNWYDNISVANDGKDRPMFCLPAHQVGPWLYTINSNKVKKEAKQALLEFQLNITQELNAVIMGKVSSAKTSMLEEQVASLTEQVRQLTELVMRLMSDRDLKDVVAQQEQKFASMGGMLMSRAKATKPLREAYRH